MLYIILSDMVCSFETSGIHCSTLVRAKKFKMASKMAAVFRRTRLSLGSLYEILENCVKVKITFQYSLINNRIRND